MGKILYTLTSSQFSGYNQKRNEYKNKNPREVIKEFSSISLFLLSLFFDSMEVEKRLEEIFIPALALGLLLAWALLLYASAA